MDEPEIISQTDTSADQSSGADELDVLLAQFDAETARPAAGNGHAENSADGADRSQISDPAETSGDGSEVDWIRQQEELYNREMDLRVQRVELNSKEKAINDTVENYISMRQQEQHEADFRSAVAQVRGDLDVSDKLVIAFIDKEARDSTKLQELWQDRLNNPRPLAAAIHQLAKDFRATYARMPDPLLTQDVAMVAQAIRGAAGPTPVEPPPNYSRMSNPELREEMRKMGINPTF